MIKKIIQSLLILAACATVAKAQDKIYRKGGEVIQANITEVGTDNIKYKIFNEPNGPIYTIEKARILKIVYQSGRIERYQETLDDPELYTEQSKEAIKLNFLAPLLGYTQINYEKSLKPGRSIEFGLGIIGLGKRQTITSWSSNDKVYREAAGAFINAGYKFLRKPDYISNSTRLSHVLQGMYAKPQVDFGVYGQNYIKSYQYNNTNGTSTPVVGYTTTVFGDFMINIGKQWVLGDAFLIDVYVGLGYGLDNRKEDQDFSYHYAIISTDSNGGIGFTSGLKIGLLLKKPHK